MRSVSGSDMRSGRDVVRVALATCAALPQLDPETERLMVSLHELGIAAVPAIWSDPSVAWRSFDLVVVRSCWDYLHRRAEFLHWCARVPHLANPADVLRWNTDKAYLRDLEARGVPVVPTAWIAPADRWCAPKDAEWVVKPAVSIAGLETGRYRMDDPERFRLASAHVARLQAGGRMVMVQPYIEEIDAAGETSLVFFGGTFSHAMRKAALLRGPEDGVDRRFLPQGAHRWPCAPTAAQLAVAKRVLDRLAWPAPDLLYARVDLVPGSEGPLLLELELTEPQLYLDAAFALPRFAHAIAARASANASAGRHACAVAG